jgi:hypothetical protein
MPNILRSFTKDTIKLGKNAAEDKKILASQYTIYQVPKDTVQ